MSSITTEIRTRLGVPTEAEYVMLFDQSAHLDWDWIQTFDEYFLTAYSGAGVNGALLSALSLLAGNGSGNVGPYYYSICEMGYFQKFISYQAQQGKDVVSQFQSVGQSLRIVGGGITSPDNLVCAGEAIIRNYLLGRLWLGQMFPELLPLKHCWIPDDFGQDPELPVVVQAMGMLSIAFARTPCNAPAHPNQQACAQFLQSGADFFWQSSDPNSKVYAHWLQGGYPQGWDIGSGQEALDNIYSYLQSNNANGSASAPYSAAPTNYLYVPIDNDFMMPVTSLLSDMQEWNTSTDPTYGYNATGVYAVAASFDDFVSLVLDNSVPVQTVSYNGTPYWTGYYMSRPATKILHYAAVRWLLAAEVFGLLASPGDFLDPLYWQRLAQAWTDFMPSTHHDYVCGTANDWVYQLEQLPLLQTAYREARRTARTALRALGSSILAASESPVVIANPAGVAHNGVVVLPGPVPSGMQGIKLDDGQTHNVVQPTYEGGLAFLAAVESLGYTTGYLTETKGTIPYEATITPDEPGQQSYTLTNGNLTVVISAASNWGIQSITDSQGNSLLKGVGNDLVFYKDAGDIYEFGNEYTALQYQEYSTFESQPVTFVTSGDGLGATVLEQGPVRVRLRTKVAVKGLPSAETYTREYILVSGEPLLRMKTTGAAPQPYPNTYPITGCSVMTAFPLSQEVNTIVHGTASHWTSVQPSPAYGAPIFQATHKYLLPESDTIVMGAYTVLGALYHRNVPAWGFSGPDDNVLPQGVLLGCLLRNTPGGPHGAKGSDTDTHTLYYALRTFDGLNDPTTGQPLSEALNYCTPPVAALVNTVALTSGSGALTLPESGFLASIESPGVILAAKPGDVTPGTIVLRLYQPTNSETPVTLPVTLGAGRPSAVTAVTALEDPITENAPVITINDNGFTIEVTTALNTVAVTPLIQATDVTDIKRVGKVGPMHEITILPDQTS